jgi:hypothetical protein
MKKDFTQLLERTASLVFLLLQDRDSGLFIIFADPEDIEEYGEESAYRTFFLKLATKTEESTALQLARFLASKGYVLNSYQELARKTQVTYSHVDDTPGSEEDVVAIHALVDIVDKKKFEKQFGQLLSLDKYAECMTSAVFSDIVVHSATAQLLGLKNYRKNVASK